MITTSRILILAASILSAAGQDAQTPRAPEISELTAHVAGRDARLGWWREARFGMFVHWGVSSVLGGSWNGRDYKTYAEHIQRAAKIPVPVYRKEVAGAFNPTLFDADAWVGLAKETGMGYFIITAKHHDGVAMYDSAPTKSNRLVEGDAGKELAKANTGAGGSCVVTISEDRFPKTVRIGRGVSEPLGRITLEPGRHVFRIAAAKVTGTELFRLRRIDLNPVRP